MVALVVFLALGLIYGEKNHFYRGPLKNNTKTIAPLSALPVPEFFIVSIIIEMDDKGVAQGSGFVIDRDAGLIATAKHVIEAGEKEGRVIKVLAFAEEALSAEEYKTSVAWKHKTADIGVLRINFGQAKNILSAAPLSMTMPPIGAAVILSGFQNGLEKKSGTYFYERDGLYLYRREVSLNIHLIDVPMKEISLTSAVEELELFVELKKKNPAIKYDDVFYRKYLVAKANNEETICDGLSGSPLLNSERKAVAVFMGNSNRRFAFTPLEEIPKNFLPR